MIKGNVESKLDSSICLNFFIEASTDVNHERIENDPVITHLGAFTLASEDLLDEKRDTSALKLGIRLWLR